MSLVALYEEVLHLTEAQGQAIADDRWDELESLLQKREKTLAEAARLLASAPQPEKDKAHALLERILSLDASNEKALLAKKAKVQDELYQLNQGQQAQNQYLDAYNGPIAPRYFDKDY